VLRLILQRAGFSIHAVPNLECAIEIWSERPSDLILIYLPEDKNLTTSQLRKLRANVGVIIFAITDWIIGEYQISVLEAGADLVICRPYRGRFLLAQTRSLSQRRPVDAGLSI